MSLSSDELWQRLRREGVATPEQCQQWALEVVPKLPDSDAKDGLKLLLQLIAAGHLSKYQAKIIAGQASGPIRYGPWLVQHPVKLPMWQGWYEVRRGTGDPQWARAISARELKQLRPLRPSLPRALKLTTLQQHGLVAGQPPELVDGTLLVFVAPCSAVAQSAVPTSAAAVQGIPSEAKLLGQNFASQRCARDEATRIASRLADILSGLHRQQIVHGRVFPDRIYLNGEHVVLAIDPLCAATGLPELPAAREQSSASVPEVESLASGLIGTELKLADALSFCAPELRVPEPIPSTASDVFSLGCVWWWLLTGQPLAANLIHPAALASDSVSASAPMPELSLPAACSLPEPLWRCLQACLARNPSSRFASADELVRALAVAQRTNPITAPQPVGTEPAKTQPAQPKPAVLDKPEQPAEQLRRAKQPLRASAVVAPAKADAASSALGTSASAAASAVAATPEAIPRRRRRRKGIPWMWPVLGGCGALIGLLVVLKMTGALQPSEDSQRASATRPATGSTPSFNNADATQPAIVDADPRSEYFEIVANRPGANQRGLWAPPNAPSPLPLDLLPPGAQLFLSLRPDQWPSLESPAEKSEEVSQQSAVSWSGVFGEPVIGYVRQLQSMAGVPLTDVAQVTLSFYAAEQSGQPLRVCARFHLSSPKPLSDLTAAWNSPTQQPIAEQQLWVSSPQQAYYIAGQSQTGTKATDAPTPADTATTVSDFSVGPLDLISEVAELQGARGPLLPHLEKLWNSTDQTADIALLVSTPFLFSDGRAVLNSLPARLHPTLKQWLGGDIRGASMQMHWQPQWYFETRVAGSNDQDAGKILASQQQQFLALPASVEQWLVSHTAHPYWRALALRFPQMLRTLVEYTRFGVENGTALTNGYLPSQGGTNLMLTSWIALQDYAELNATASVANSTPAAGNNTPAPIDIEAYLSQPIKLSFDQEPIEVALQLVAEEANAKLPEGTAPLRFVLDGAAFGKAGITRNQQLSNFRIEQRPVRDALTEIARRGNPVPTVTDLRQEDQRLLWLVAPDPQSASGAPMISLTTRAAAKESRQNLPVEFAPE